MSFDCVTIGDAMRDTFLFPSIDEMEKPIDSDDFNPREKYDKYLVFGLGDKITISETENSIGGSANNVAAAMSKMGFKTAIVSATGDDTTGQELRKEIDANGINTQNVKVYRSKKTSFSIIVSYKGERTIFVYHAFGPEQFKLPEKISTSWFYLGPMAKGYERLFDQIVAQRIKQEFSVAINPGSVQINAGLHSFGGLLNFIDVIFLNKEEAMAISGLKGFPTIKEAAKVIQFQGPKLVVITDGGNGAYAYDGEDLLKVGAYPGHRLEATGAGDSFAAGFLAAKMNGEKNIDCLKWGVVNSASVIEKIGAQTGLLSKTAIQKRIRDYHWPASSLRFS